MPLPESSQPQPSEAKAVDEKRTDWKVSIVRRSSHELLSSPPRSTVPLPRSAVSSKSPPLSRGTSSHTLSTHDDPDSDDDDEEESLPDSIPSMSRTASLPPLPTSPQSFSSPSTHSSRSNSFRGSPAFSSTSSGIPIPSPPMMITSSSPHHSPLPHSPLAGLASSLESSSSSSSEHVQLSQDPDASDSDDELPPSDPHFGLGSGIHSPPSADSDELPPVLSDDDDFPPAPTLIRQTGYYKSPTSRGCSCLEPEERTDGDSYMYSR